MYNRTLIFTKVLMHNSCVLINSNTPTSNLHIFSMCMEITTRNMHGYNQWVRTGFVSAASSYKTVVILGQCRG